MIPILYEKEELTFASNGIGRLTDAISCTVTEERNGIYELEMTYPCTGEMFSQLTRGRYIYTTHDEGKVPQAFQIYKVTKPINGVCTYYAQHISYQLSKIVVKPFTATSCADAMSKLKANAIIYNDFNFITDKSVAKTWNVMTPSSIRSLLGGEQNSILDVYGTGEYEWDMFNVYLKLHRGTDTGVTIRYGKNLTDFNMDVDYDGTYTAIAPYWEDSNGEEASVYLPEGYLIMPNVPTYASNLVTDSLDDLLTDAADVIDIDYYDVEVVPLDLSNEFDEKPTVNELRERAMLELSGLTAWRPTENITANFVQLADTEEYADYAPLERVKLCDTVSVYFTKMGVTAANMKVIRVVWDALQERYLEMELGEPRTSMTDVITQTVESRIETSQTIDNMSSYVNSLTQIITNGMGLFSSKESKSGGGYVYYLHNQPKRSDSQFQWTINANGFAVSTDYGNTWQAGIDANGNATFNTLSANIINGMEIHGAIIEGAKFVFSPQSIAPVKAYGVKWADDWGGVIFTGDGDFTVDTGTIGLTGRGRANSDQEIQIKGLDGNEVMRNLILTRDGSLALSHYDEDGNLRGSVRLTDSGVEAAAYKDDGTSKVSITLDKTDGLGVWFDGVGYNGLGFVNDGNGHAVLGK